LLYWSLRAVCLLHFAEYEEGKEEMGGDGGRA
jgi:hypothetical protein